MNKNALDIAIEVLTAAREGKTVQWRIAGQGQWHGEATYDFRPEMREWPIKPEPDPAKVLREFVMHPEHVDMLNASGNRNRSATIYRADDLSLGFAVFREVDPAHDAEIAELRRNHDALVQGIKEFIDVYHVPGGYLHNALGKHGAKFS